MRTIAAPLSGLSLLALSAIASAAPKKLFLSEVFVSPTAAEFIEVHNAGATTVDLTNYYLADHDAYYLLVAGELSPGSDFLVRFPTGTHLSAGDSLVVSIPGAECFLSACGTVGPFTGFGFYPDFEIPGAPSGSFSNAVPDMLEPYAGAVSSGPTLTNTGEPIVLFYWDGVTDLITDVDYVYVGAGGVSNPAVNKTGQVVNGETYQDDTDDDAQLHAPLAGTTPTGTIRVDFSESSQTQFFGNGISGADETSETSSVTWQASSTPEPTVSTQGTSGSGSSSGAGGSGGSSGSTGGAPSAGVGASDPSTSSSSGAGGAGASPAEGGSGPSAGGNGPSSGSGGNGEPGITTGSGGRYDSLPGDDATFTDTSGCSITGTSSSPVPLAALVCGLALLRRTRTPRALSRLTSTR